MPEGAPPFSNGTGAAPVLWGLMRPYDVEKLIKYPPRLGRGQLVHDLLYEVIDEFGPSFTVVVRFGFLRLTQTVSTHY